MRNILARAGVCLLMLTSACLAQTDIFTISHTATLSGASTALSVALPDAGANVVEIVEVTAGCSAACSIRLENNGAASTANGSTILAVTPVPLNPESTAAPALASPKVRAFSGSGIAVGTAVGPVWDVPAGAILPFGGGRILIGFGGATNYTIRVVGSYTGSVDLYFSVRVRR